MELTAPEVWSRVLRDAKAALPAQSYETWLAGTSAVGISDEELIVEAPSQFHVEWLEDKYGPLLSELLAHTLGRPFCLSLRPSAVESALSIPSFELDRPSPAAAPDPVARPASHPQLNDRYTFDSFVVGSNNELASAASHAVAEQPARMYNPLFIYGGVGLGKTHLMHAIGNEIVASFPRMRVAYVSSEQFTNELVTSIQEGQTAEFRRRYRLMDLLLVDDIHFLAGKDRTQEEFFHTFNALYDAKKQIVLTSDRPPKDMGGLEERLVSRFEWGLVADIRPPDYETRVAILRKKAIRDGLVLDDAVIDLVARSCTSSVRELEGAVIKLLAFSSLAHREIDEDLARTALQGIGRPNPVGPALSADAIREAVASEFGVSTASLSSKRRTRNLTVPRQVAMYLIKELLDPPLVLIGHMFGGRDHSTVIHSLKKVEQALSADDDAFKERIGRLRRKLETGR